ARGTGRLVVGTPDEADAAGGRQPADLQVAQRFQVDDDAAAEAPVLPDDDLAAGEGVELDLAPEPGRQVTSLGEGGPHRLQPRRVSTWPGGCSTPASSSSAARSTTRSPTRCAPSSSCSTPSTRARTSRSTSTPRAVRSTPASPSTTRCGRSIATSPPSPWAWPRRWASSSWWP